MLKENSGEKQCKMRYPSYSCVYFFSLSPSSIFFLSSRKTYFFPAESLYCLLPASYYVSSTVVGVVTCTIELSNWKILMTTDCVSFCSIYGLY